MVTEAEGILRMIFFVAKDGVITIFMLGLVLRHQGFPMCKKGERHQRQLRV